MTDISTDVIAAKEGFAGRLRLNRPRALHSLNRSMVRDMAAALNEWRGDPDVRIILIDHADGRGFCAGGDVVDISQNVEGHEAAARAFFFDEYRLNHLEYTYPKPGVAFMDGVTMGGGVGVACPCRYRVATERTLLAMPETTIGIFPDVGGGRYLSRLRGRLAQFLALTGARLDGAECLKLRLATHYLPSDRLEEAKERIMAQPFRVTAILDELSEENVPDARIAANLAKIDRYFASDRLEDILAALDAGAAEGDEWAATEANTIRKKSPMACKVSLKLLVESPYQLHFVDEMRMEYGIMVRLIRHPDFREGVRALLIDKDNAPRWSASDPAEISDAEVDAFFEPLPAAEEWTPFDAEEQR
ncbi:enoyl-CoA hydratase/isomerase family protein [Sphingomonas sp. LY160]|uniref:enoyl-CoA hydratase/isomerase family protein n=1 Tax=Sphingomonas sp. LY160 TaxID=3095342 RepID=UPI002ADECD02|nr:enoyl-CoA hydratase/isomerase family protein [Sphingomonas sp. LY160]MEA1073213.1 enoyl-CoA hydratase/isomerase family protein [Sphingomonas sp. LY160]